MGPSGARVGGFIYPLRQTELDRIAKDYKAGVPFSAVAKKLHRSRTVIWQCYKKLKAGETLVVTSLQPIRSKEPSKRKEEIAPPPKPKVKKPLVNPNRFYRSEFIPT